MVGAAAAAAAAVSRRVAIDFRGEKIDWLVCACSSTADNLQDVCSLITRRHQIAGRALLERAD